MDFYFDPPERRQQLKAVLATWAGTPFVEGASTPGEGCDCTRFALGVLGGCGMPIDELPPLPRFSLREGRHREETRLMVWLHSSDWSKAHLSRALKDDPAHPGDVIACKPHGSLGANHLAIAESAGVYWHCDLSVGVTTIMPQHLRTVAIYRLRDNFPA